MENIDFIKILNRTLNDHVKNSPVDDIRCLANVDDSTICESRLQLHRLRSKFEFPSRENEEALHDKCIANFHRTEKRINSQWHSDETTAWIRGNPSLLLRIRLEIIRLLRDFRFSSEDCDFGPGEQFISSGGMTSSYDKWLTQPLTCTRGNFDLLARSIYANKTYRRLIWKKVTLRYKIDVDLYSKSRTYRFEYFKKHLYFAVTFVEGNRLSSVYKDKEKRRTICVEALGNLFTQKGIGAGLARVLSKAGNDGPTGQQRHADLILNDSVSTIDFSEASDSIHLGVIEFLFPRWFFSLILQARSPFVEIDGSWHRVEKVSSMGNGFTWELMTLLLLAITRALNSDIGTTYGDDVIIEDDLAHEFCIIAEALGFSVNQKKTFIAQLFKESCGAFVHGGKALTSFDFTYVYNELQARATMNKLYILGRKNHVFRSLWLRLIGLVPIADKGPAPDISIELENLDKYYWAENLPSVNINAGTRWIARAYCYNTDDIFKVNSFQPAVVDLRFEEGSIPSFVEYLLRMKNHARPIRSVRHDDDNLPLVGVSLYYHRTQGFIMSSRQYKNLRAQLTSHLKSIFDVDELSAEMWDAYLTPVVVR